MKQSNGDLLHGLQALQKGQPFPEELFYRIFEIEDVVERTQYIETARNTARDLKRVTEFNSVLKAFFTDYQQQMHARGNTTQFTGQPLELECAGWIAGDSGVYTERLDNQWVPVRIMACSHPIMPVRILKNVDTGEERVTLAYFKYGEWQHVTVNREACADNAAIVKVLSRIGVEVTSENAKYLVRYISDCIGMNPAKLLPLKAINRLGWCGNEFMPYAKDIVYDGDQRYESIFRNIKSGGSYEVWREHCGKLRKNIIVRLAFAAAAGSALIEKLNILPFVFHIWAGDSGTCKTVAVMAGMSIWGNPKMGGLVKTMDATSVNVRAASAFLYSIPYAGDELQTIKNSNYFTNYDRFIYQITEGIDRGRGSRDGGVQETKTWHCSYLFTGEEPITKQNSRSGAKNRCIEVEADEKLMDDGNYTVRLLTNNYGFAGERLVEYISSTEAGKLQAEYKQYFDQICKLDTTEKQAMAMSCMLVADRILTDLIFTDETKLTIKDVKKYLRSAKEVDIASRSYESTLNWIAKNPVRFQTPIGPDATNRGEVWGKIVEDEKHPEEPPVAVVNKDVLCEFLEKSGFDYTAISKKWADKGHLVKNSQGKFVHQTKVYGIKASYVKIVMEPSADKDGFVKVEDLEDGQMELPFK